MKIVSQHLKGQKGRKKGTLSFCNSSKDLKSVKMTAVDTDRAYNMHD